MLDNSIDLSKAQNRRAPLIDVIYTQGGGSTFGCCIAYKSGALYGIRSTNNICRNNHKLSFIDNEFKKYDHELHKRVVAANSPKYTTVMDLFSPEQAASLKLKHCDFDQVMKWADELSNYAENVIVIPKYDCISDIPDKYILGYSVPSSYGGTELSIYKFKHRKVHLLGGSPRRQYLIWSVLTDAVVSADSNYIHYVSGYGRVTNIHLINKVFNTNLATREDIHIKKLGFSNVLNPFYVAFSINVGYYIALFSVHPSTNDWSLDVEKLKGVINLDEF